MLLSVHTAIQSQQATVAQGSSLASCSSQHRHVGKGKAHRRQPISWKTLYHPKAVTPQQHGKSKMHKAVQDFKMIQDQLLEDQEHDTEVIKKQEKEACEHYVNGIQEQNCQEEYYDLHSLDKQEEHQKEHHIPKTVQGQEIDTVTMQEQEHYEQNLDRSTEQEQEQVQEQDLSMKKAQRVQLSHNQQHKSNKVQKLKQSETQENLQLQKTEQVQELLNVNEQENLRSEKEFQLMDNKEQEDLKLVQTQKRFHPDQELQVILSEAGEQQLQWEHQQEFRKIKLQPELQPLQKGEQKQYQDQVPVPDNYVVPDQQQPKCGKVLHTLLPMKSSVYRQRYQNGYFYAPPMSRATKAAYRRKAYSEDNEDIWKAARSCAGQELHLQGYIISPVFAKGTCKYFEDVEDHHLDEKKLEASDCYHIKSKDPRGISANRMSTKHFDGLEHRDVIEVSKELDFYSGKYFEFKDQGRSGKKYLLPKRMQELRNGDSYKRSFKAAETKQEGLELKDKFENLKDLQSLKFRELKGLKARPFNPKSTEFRKAELLDPHINKELERQEGLHSNSPKIQTSGDQLCKLSDSEIKAATVDDKEQCISWGKALVKCLKEMQARTSLQHILHEFGHSGSCMMANCRPSCRLFRRLRHHVVSAQHKCSLFHLYTSLLQKHVSMCSSPVCGLRACPAIRANRRIRVSAASHANAKPCVTVTQVEIGNKM